MNFLKKFYEKTKRLQLLEKSIWHDFKYLVPLSMLIGFGLETFMVKSGFYKILVKKEEEKLVREREEIKKAKIRLDALKREIKDQ